MKTKSTKNFETDITVHLVRISGDVEHIKEKVDSNNKHLQAINGRVRETEKQLSLMKGIGATVTFVISALIAWIKTSE